MPINHLHSLHQKGIKTTNGNRPLKNECYNKKIVGGESTHPGYFYLKIIKIFSQTWNKNIFQWPAINAIITMNLC